MIYIHTIYIYILSIIYKIIYHVKVYVSNYWTQIPASINFKNYESELQIQTCISCSFSSPCNIDSECCAQLQGFSSVLKITLSTFVYVLPYLY